MTRCGYRFFVEDEDLYGLEDTLQVRVAVLQGWGGARRMPATAPLTQGL